VIPLSSEYEFANEFLVSEPAVFYRYLWNAQDDRATTLTEDLDHLVERSLRGVVGLANCPGLETKAPEQSFETF
jgi:hypothetical protein